MADVRLSGVKTVSDWVEAYYGTDAMDYKKVEKIRHVQHTSQFAALCYVISHNTKTAHTDFFETNYTGSDTKISRVASFVLQLLQRKFENGSISTSDFDELEKLNGNLFSGEKNRQKLIEDYMGEGGILDMCQSCLPIFNDDEKTAKNIKSINDDIEEIKRDHSYLLSVTGKKDSTSLSREEIQGMLFKATECSQKRWDEMKSNKSKSEVQLQKDMEAAFYNKGDLARKTIKMGALGAVGAASFGAVIGGVFWPALLLIPVYGLGKNWYPGWFKSMGAVWGSFQNKAKDKRDIKRFDAMQKYTIGFAENGKNYKPPLKVRWYLRGIDKTILKKQAKQMAAGIDFEGSDGKMKTSENTIVARALANGLGNVIDVKAGDELVPVDAVDVLRNKINGLTRDLDENGNLKKDNTGKPVLTVSFQEINNLAETFRKWESSLPTTAKQELKGLFAQKTAQICETLIFDNPLDDLNYIKAEVLPKFIDSSDISEVLKGGSGVDVARIKNYVSFASKELTGLNNTYQCKTLREYIDRQITAVTSIDLNSYIRDPDSYAIAELINDLKIDETNNETFITSTNTGNVKVLGENGITQRIGKLADENKRNELDNLLKAKMDYLTQCKARELSKATFDSIKNRTLNGKVSNLSDLFAKIGEIKFDTVDSISTLYSDIGKLSPKDVANYVKSKLRKQVYDIFYYKGKDSENTFATNIGELSTYLKKVNSCEYLDDSQKMDLSARFSPLVEKSFYSNFNSLLQTFMSNYNAQNFSNYLNSSYEQGGFRELFESDHSQAIQNLKANINYMIEMDEFYKTLKFGEQFDIDPTDAQYISKSLLTDRASGEQKLATSGYTDPLGIFIMNYIKQVPGFEENDLINGIQGSQVYAKLKDALDVLKNENQNSVFGGYNSSDTINKNDYDRYTGLIILKNKFKAMVKLYMRQYVSKYSGGNNSWLNSHSDVLPNITTQWTQLANEIDAAIGNYSNKTNFQKCSSYTAIDELNKYSTASEAESSYSSRQL